MRLLVGWILLLFGGSFALAEHGSSLSLPACFEALLHNSASTSLGALSPIYLRGERLVLRTPNSNDIPQLFAITYRDVSYLFSPEELQSQKKAYEEQWREELQKQHELGELHTVIVSTDRQGTPIGAAGLKVAGTEKRFFRMYFGLYEGHRAKGHEEEAFNLLSAHIFEKERINRVFLELGSDRDTELQMMERMGIAESASPMGNLSHNLWFQITSKDWSRIRQGR